MTRFGFDSAVKFATEFIDRLHFTAELHRRVMVDVAACLTELKAQKFDGHISVEYENDWKDNVPQVRAEIEFVKTHAK